MGGVLFGALCAIATTVVDLWHHNIPWFGWGWICGFAATFAWCRGNR